jgi:hypothetical protein
MKSYLYFAKAALACAILTIVCSAARADNFAYAVGVGNGTTNLYKIDLTTVQATEIGNLGVLMEGLANTASGALYGTDDGGSLYLINVKTAQTTLIGSTGQGDIEGLDFDGTKLLGIDFTVNPSAIFSIDTANAKIKNLVTASESTGDVRSMCVQGEAHVLVVGDGPPEHTLYSIDLRSGAVFTIGTLGITATEMPAMDFVNGVFYGLDVSGNEWIINPANADVTLVGNTGSQLWLDMKAFPAQ